MRNVTTARRQATTLETAEAGKHHVLEPTTSPAHFHFERCASSTLLTFDLRLTCCIDASPGAETDAPTTPAIIAEEAGPETATEDAAATPEIETGGAEAIPEIEGGATQGIEGG